MSQVPHFDSDLVRFIYIHDTAGKLLREHAPAAGHCPRCPAGPTGSGRMVSPCSLYAAALRVQELRAAKKPPLAPA